MTSDEPETSVRRPSTGDAVAENETSPLLVSTEKERPVSWSELPKKSQLAILILARLAEPIAQTSLQSYVFYQLAFFRLPDGSKPSDATVAKQAGVLAAAFTGGQCVTAIVWGRLADSIGRKRVLLVGMLGTALGALGFGFSQSFPVAVFWRCVAGLLNGNAGIVRTTLSEIIKEKKYQSRAFLLLPITFNVGVTIGPLMGGVLADPAGTYPDVFGPSGPLGAAWLVRWPYALPSIINAAFLLTSATALALGLEETLESRRNSPDYGLRFSRWFGSTILRIKQKPENALVFEQGPADSDVEPYSPTQHGKARDNLQKLPFWRIWTTNVLLTLLSHGTLACHLGTFHSLWFIFLSTPRYETKGRQHDICAAEDYSDCPKHTSVTGNQRPHIPFAFTGGLALPPSSIGAALAILGVIGITLQLLLYPHISFRLGTVRSLRYSLLLFPISYALAPFLVLIPSNRPPPDQATGMLVWLGISLVLSIQVLGRTFAMPASAITVNNSSPHPSVLATVHGIAQTVSSAAKTAGPVVFSYLYSVGLQRGMVGIGWWSLACLAILGALFGQLVRDGDGHEILLDGEHR